MSSWTKMAPTERGYYWLRCDDYERTPCVVHVWNHPFDGRWFADRPDFCDPIDLLENPEWCGPLASPDEQVSPKLLWFPFGQDREYDDWVAWPIGSRQQAPTPSYHVYDDMGRGRSVYFLGICGSLHGTMLQDWKSSTLDECKQICETHWVTVGHKEQQL